MAHLLSRALAGGSGSLGEFARLPDRASPASHVGAQPELAHATRRRVLRLVAERCQRYTSATRAGGICDCAELTARVERPFVEAFFRTIPRLETAESESTALGRGHPKRCATPRCFVRQPKTTGKGLRRASSRCSRSIPCRQTSPAQLPCVLRGTDALPRCWTALILAAVDLKDWWMSIR